MFEDILDFLKGLLKSRLLFLVILFTAGFILLIQRVFTLQIVEGDTYSSEFSLKIRKERIMSSSRGKIYDRNGVELAYNELAYSITIEDNGTYATNDIKNDTLNTTIYDLIEIIEDNGDAVNNDFNIVIDGGRFTYTVEGTQLERFKADVYGETTFDKLEKSKQNISAPGMIADLCKSFGISDEYSDDDILKIINIRYAMKQNEYSKYLATTVATNVSTKTVTVVYENSDRLQGVAVEEDTVRVYADSKYFSHIIGYTGKASQDELEDLQEINEGYTLNDIVGKAGVEQILETELQGEKGYDVVMVDKMGKVIETVDGGTDPVAGNDLHLTIDSGLQKAVYDLIEQKLAGILVDKMRDIQVYTPGANSDAGDILIPVYDAYYNLLDNNIVAINGPEGGASQTERDIYQSFLGKQESVIQSLISELTASSPSAYKDLPQEMQIYMSYIVSNTLMADTGILVSDAIDKTDETYLAWTKHETISLKEYLTYAISRNWIDLSDTGTGSRYLDASEIYEALVEYITEYLKTDTNFSKKMYKYMLQEGSLTGREVCLLLYEQGVLSKSDDMYQQLAGGSITAYNFLIAKIKALEITPAQLALYPSTGSCVITDVNTGEVLACVTYPGYDNNRLANTMDSDYYNEMLNDNSRPLYNNATQEKTAPGSTFKMVSALAGLSEGVISLSDTINCVGTYDRISPEPKCWNRHGHGSENLVSAIKDSCNYYFYEVGYRLGTDASGRYDAELGLQKLEKYADMFGLNERTGIEIEENAPQISNEDAVRSAIGQGTNNYTTAQLARYVSTVANSGTLYELTLLSKLTDSDQNVIMEYQPVVSDQLDFNDSHMSAVQAGMEEVTAGHAAFTGISGLKIGGKSGTAQQMTTRPNHALFVTYAGRQEAEIAMSVRIAYGYTSANSADVSADIIRYYYNLADEEELLTGSATEASAATGD